MASKLSSTSTSSSSSSFFKSQDGSFVEPFSYVTKNLVNQELELQARSQLFKIKSRIKAHEILKGGRLEVARHSFSKDFLNFTLSDVLQSLGNPTTTKEFVAKLEQFMVDESNYNSSLASSNATQDSNIENCNVVVPKTPMASCKRDIGLPPLGSTSKNRYVFPNPLVTPLNKVIPSLQTPIFNFGSANSSSSKKGGLVNGQLLSTVKKTPRAPKPGETIFAFSASGSPVQANVEPVIPSTCRTARIKLDDGHGKLIDVDLVYRGNEQDGKEFGKIVTDIRGLIATRSQANRKLLPSRAMLSGKKKSPIRRR